MPVSDPARPDTPATAAPRPVVAPPIYDRRYGLSIIAVTAGIALLGVLVQSPYWYGLLDSWLVMSILGVGFYLVFGVGGQFAFSQAAFFGVGAYSSAWAARLTGSFWIGVLAALVITAVVAWLFGLLMRRADHLYFAIATMAFGFVALTVFREFEAFTGSGGEVLNIRPPEVMGQVLSTDASRFWLLLGFLVLTLVLTSLIERSPLRREAIAHRDKPTVAATLGLPTLRLRLVMFALGSAYAGVAGSLHAHRFGFISTDSFSIGLGIDIFLILLFGGIGSMWGPLLGAAFVVVAPEYLDAIGQYQDMLFGVVLVLVIVTFPDGLVGVLARVAGRGNLDRPSLWARLGGRRAGRN